MNPGGYSPKRCVRRLRLEVKPRTLLNTVFDRKGTPFLFLPLKNGTPFTYLVYNFAFILTAVHALSLKHE